MESSNKLKLAIAGISTSLALAGAVGAQDVAEPKPVADPKPAGDQQTQQLPLRTRAECSRPEFREDRRRRRKCRSDDGATREESWAFCRREGLCRTHGRGSQESRSAATRARSPQGHRTAFTTIDEGAERTRQAESLAGRGVRRRVRQSSTRGASGGRFTLLCGS